MNSVFIGIHGVVGRIVTPTAHGFTVRSVQGNKTSHDVAMFINIQTNEEKLTVKDAVLSYSHIQTNHCNLVYKFNCFIFFSINFQ